MAMVEAALSFAKLRMANGEFDEQTRVLAEQAARFSGVSGPESHITLGQFELAQGNSKAAMEWLASGLARGAGTPSDRFVFANTLIENGRTDAAGQELRALLSGPDFPEKDQARAALETLGAKRAPDSSTLTDPSADPAAKAAG